MPYCQQTWHLYVAFLALGAGMACLSTNTIGSTLAPWFERLQGRAMSTAMLGASIGGMIGTPLLMTGIRNWGFHATTALAGAVAVMLVLPSAIWVLKSRPQDVGQFADGAGFEPEERVSKAVQWTFASVISTRQFLSHVIAFGVGLMVQIGFLSHHVSIGIPVLGERGAAVAVFVAAVAAFVGRLLLTRYADNVDVRKVGAGVLALAAASLVGIVLFPGAWAFLTLSITFGLTVGNVTTLAPMIIRKEFGAASFGVVFGLAATINQLAMSLGPTLYGTLRDVFGSYSPALLLGAAMNVAAALVLVWGGRSPLSLTSAETVHQAT